MASISKNQKEFYKKLLTSRENNHDTATLYRFDELMSPSNIRGDGPPSVNNFYLKPLHVIAPHEQFLSNKELACDCGKKLVRNGWSDFRYVHSLKTGQYLVQQQYRSHSQCTCPDKQTTYLGLKVLQFRCVPDYVRLMYPLTEKYNSVYDNDFISYVSGDALTGTVLIYIF